MCDDLLIPGFLLTKSWLQDRIEERHAVRPNIGKVTPLGKDATGYMSLIRRVQLEWSCNRSELPNSVIVKIPFTAAVHDALDKSSGTSSSQEDMNLLQKVFHSVESRFYRIVEEEKQKPLLVPTIYANEDSDADQPVIVMQDYQSCYVVDLVQGFSEKQLFAIVDQIVKLQAFAMKNKKCVAFQQPPEMNQLMSTFTAQCKLICLNLMGSEPVRLSCIKIFMANTFDRDSDWMTKMVNEYESGERPSVLTHGDLWAANILWWDNSSIGGMVDWQAAHRGSPVIVLYTVAAKYLARPRFWSTEFLAFPSPIMKASLGILL
ncbi:hypothetical protein Y032_0018g3715 [Ancylostoma ceylanicum]|nr:hypothetical protein Y032_0018g3715 [Ancylostoma ceylanicum]